MTFRKKENYTLSIFSMNLLERRLPDDLLRRVFLFLTFQDLHNIGYTVGRVMTYLGIRPPKEARWIFLFHRNRYVPFRITSSIRSTDHSSISSISSIHVKGQIFTGDNIWVFYGRNCYSPWEYQTFFRNEATPEMVPRVVVSKNPKVEITYRGRRTRTNPPVRFQKGQEVDVMDEVGVWWKGSMVSWDSETQLLRYHFHGWDSCWDVWYPVDSLHVAPLHSIVPDWRSMLQKGDFCDYKHHNNGRWYEGCIVNVTPNLVTVRISVEHQHIQHIQHIQRSSERLMFFGAHTGFHQSPLRVSNVLWKDENGTEVYQYRIRGIKTVLVDHLLSDEEFKDLRI